MKRTLLGLGAAVFVHLLILLFGGIFFIGDDSKTASKQVIAVEALTEEAKPDEEEPTPERVVEEAVQEQQETPPDMTELVKLQDASPAAAAPALDALSLASLEAALQGQAGGGDFAVSGGSLASGGRIGGTGAPGAEGADGSSLDAIFSIGDLDQKARPIFQASPNYPYELRQKKVTGEVYLIFVVDDLGRVQHPKVEKSTHQQFEQPALDAVKQWKFEPAVRSGKKVASKLRIPIRFQL
jgi:protein TonB